MVVFLWLWNIISPIILFLGLGYIATGEAEGWEFIAGGGAALLGFIIGFTGWAETVPPRWFWVKSSVDLFDNRFFTALSYALQFFLIPSAIMGIIEVIDML